MPLPPYTPDPTDISTPTDFKSGGHAAAELRALKGRVNGVNTNLSNAISNEENARLAADSTLQNNINSEASTRQADDIVLQNNITAEENARINADNAIVDHLILNAISAQAVRQTVLSAPLDGSGNPDFLSIDAGAVGIKSTVSGSPLIITCGGGFGAVGSQKNYGAAITSGVTAAWSSLPSDDISYLYMGINISTGVVSFFHSTAAPEYGTVRPVGATVNQFFYDVRHIGLAHVWNGTSWEPKAAVCVGECTTSSGVVTAVINYALQGQEVVDSGSFNLATNGTLTESVGHKLGIPGLYISTQVFWKLVTASGPLGVGDLFDVTNSYDWFASSGPPGRELSVTATYNNIELRTVVTDVAGRFNAFGVDFGTSNFVIRLSRSF